MMLRLIACGLSVLAVASCAPTPIVGPESVAPSFHQTVSPEPGGRPSGTATSPGASASWRVTATPSVSEPPSPSFAPRTVTINVSGDLLWHNSLWTSAEMDARTTGVGVMDFIPQLESLRSYVSQADLGICHSEVPFAPAGGPYGNYPLFAAPQEAALAIKDIGWDLCTTASNHTMDQGWEGLVRTVDVYEATGIVTAGSYRTAEEAATPVIYTTDDGVKVAIVSQTYGLNGLPKAEGKQWSVDLIDADKAIADAARAKQAGADVVAVHMHAGDEYSSTVNAQQQDFAEAVAASPDVDFLFGQHAHVPQPIDKVGGKWVIYGGGNLISAMSEHKPLTYDGYMAQITLTEQSPGQFAATAAEFAPTYITGLSSGSPARVYVIPDALKAGTGPAELMQESAARTRATVLSLGVEGLTERQ